MALCAIFGHKPDRSRVWNDGQDFRCPCRSCGRSMIRDFEGWRMFDSDTDQVPGRPTRASRPDAH